MLVVSMTSASCQSTKTLSLMKNVLRISNYHYQQLMYRTKLHNRHLLNRLASQLTGASKPPANKHSFIY